jgi:hypothetical protein
MKSILQFRGVPLFWNQPHLLEPTFELKSNDEILGILHFKNSFGSRAYGTTSEGEWTFKRQGLHTPMLLSESQEMKLTRQFIGIIPGVVGARLNFLTDANSR